MLIIILLFQSCRTQCYNNSLINVDQQTYYYSIDCQPPTSLELNCSSLSSYVEINVDSSISWNLSSFITNCGGVKINTSQIEIGNIHSNQKKAGFIENKYIIIVASQDYSFFANAQINMKNYLLAFFLNSTQNSTIHKLNATSNKMLFVFNNSVTFEDSNFLMTTQTCTNNVNILPGMISIFNVNFESIEDYLLHNQFINLQQPTRFTAFFQVSNYTFFVFSNSSLTLINSQVIASQIGVLNNGTIILENSNLNTSFSGCYINQGNARGPEFINYNQKCFANGGSNSGYGGIGLNIGDSYLNDCIFLTNSTRFMFDLYPYGYLLTNLYQGSGGSSVNLIELVKEFGTVSKNLLYGFGGGSIFIYANQSVSMSHSQLLANGSPGYVDSETNYSIGGGAGGSIKIYSTQIISDLTSNISIQGGDSDSKGLVGEGGGGVFQFKCLTTPLNINQAQNLSSYCSSSSYNGNILNGPGLRYKQLGAGLIGQQGNLIEPLCPPGYRISNFQCVLCNQQQYSIWWSSQCVPCPSTYGKFSQDNTFCNQAPSCQTADCCIEDFKILRNTGIQLVVFMLLIIIGYALRRQYKKKDSTTEKNFNFENATKEIIADKIITESLQETDQFVLGDLMYHAHRIPVIGNNTFLNPWFLHSEPPVEIDKAVNKEEYEKFAKNFNEIAAWSKTKYIILNFLAILYYPLYWGWQTKIKKDKYKSLAALLNKNEIPKFWKQSSDQTYGRFKMTKSADYTLLYIDIFNYKNCDLKYIYLTCPFIIYLSGEGNYLRPFYLCESDQFLVSLFFAVNQTKNSIQNRQNILTNLVCKDEREENSKEIRRFLKKFNKVAMTLDLGALDSNFISNFKRLFDLLEKWNNQFFNNHDVKLQLLVAQFPFDSQHQSSTITLIEMKQEAQFKEFMRELHKNLIFQKLQDVKFGVFIFNTEQDPAEVDQQLKNQKLSFNDIEDFSIRNIEYDYDDENSIDVELLREQFLSKSTDKDHLQMGHTKHQFKQITKKQSQRPNSFSKTYHLIIRIFDYIRFQSFSHKRTFLDKYTLIIMICILILIDNFLLQSILSLIIEKYHQMRNSENHSKEDIIILQLILFPYPLTIILSNLFESIWIPSQSYGILKLYLIFNAMATFQYFVSLLIFVCNPKQQICIQDTLTFLSFLIKITLNQLSERLIPMSTKLNQLSNEKQM
ncbi:unnamed protein product (macronuclear) [Paramecium tetraurelia]|uniref:Tyrosine-protein kinase ephrin type A/B receptor-like domain-containing protein n=1 Tax=Paramecium tetraurelia TaxID=5888 RepID=A0BY52_PARTE|nr:uncharacterized protein GSPATT00033322001 [Paramecium tetraurelia]CAK63469.1 unnamed protein product [Paramecium tetraurelia]|eukprot:XP_001430867.1 hypothetical protein (macronuclear) [Paramecium tetraurelia strain d4-2]